MKDHPQRWLHNHAKAILLLVVIGSIVLIDLVAGLIFLPEQITYKCAHAYYHHDQIPNLAINDVWGDANFPVYTNSLGFRDLSVRDISLKSDVKRILFIGDSFTKGEGVPYERTFVGAITKSVDKNQLQILNAAASSYSPRLYYLKVKYLLEHVGLQFNELFVFIDISDIQDEILYEKYEPLDNFQWHSLQLKTALRKRSFIYDSIDRIASRKYRNNLPVFQAGYAPALSEEGKALMKEESFYGQKQRQLWTVDRALYEQWGKKGLSLAEKNMERLVSLCRQHDIKITVAVYPGPYQVFHKDLNSIQVLFWKKFARKQGIGFINLFPLFVNNEDPKTVYDKYFIPTDVHWNEQGHLLVAREVIKYITY